MIITHIRFSTAVPVPGLSGAHMMASVNNGVTITREGDLIRLSAGDSTVFIPFHVVTYFSAEEAPAPKAKRGTK